MQSLKAIDDLFEEMCGFSFTYSPSLFFVEVILQFSLIAEFHHNDKALSCSEIVNVAYNVLIMHTFQYFFLILDKFQ